MYIDNYCTSDGVYVRQTNLGQLAFPCKHCRKLNYINIDINAIAQPYFSDERGIVRYIDTVIGIRCPECGRRHQYRLQQGLDPNIAECIMKLNDKNYRTVFSCEGHHEYEGEQGLAYIYFKTTDYMKIFKHYPPKDPWEIDSDDLKKDCELIIRVPAEKDCTVEERVKSLSEWIDTLPYIVDVSRAKVFRKK